MIRYYIQSVIIAAGILLVSSFLLYQKQYFFQPEKQFTRTKINSKAVEIRPAVTSAIKPQPIANPPPAKSAQKLKEESGIKSQESRITNQESRATMAIASTTFPTTAQSVWGQGSSSSAVLPPSAAKTPSVAATAVKISTEELYAAYRPITLNIWCNENGKITSGTATIVHPSGILLTNAHIISPIQNTEQCVLRSWNPFNNIAKFKIIYIPDQKKIISGTNNLPQNDFAFIKITESFSKTATSSWPFAPLSAEPPAFTAGESFFIFSFATEFLSYEVSVKGVPLLFSTLKIKNLATIDDDNRDIDALILESGITNQSGSSGGPLVNINKSTVAMLSFIGSGKTTGEREGVAILISYIDRVMRRETGVSLKEFLNMKSAAD